MTNDLVAKSKRSSLLSGVALFATTLTAYICLPTKDYYWDGVYFSLNIEKANRLEPFLFHPNHLLYEVVGFLAYRAAGWAGFHIRALSLLQLMNSIFGALAALVLFDVLLRCTRSLYIACSCAMLFGFSAMWWRYSTDADAYILSVMFVLVAFRAILPEGKPRPFRVGIAHALSMLFHELAVFAYPVLMLGLIYQTASSPARQRRRVLGEYTATAGLLTLAPYWWGFTAQRGPHTVGHFFHWITYSSPGTHFTFNAWQNLTASLKGQVQLLFGGRFTLMQRYINPAVSVLVVLLGILCLTLVYLLARHFNEFHRWWLGLVSPDGKLRRLWTLSLLWIGIYAVFLYFWLPRNTFYRLFYLPPIVFLVAVALYRLEQSTTTRRRHRTALFAAIVVLWNLVFYVYPYSHASSNPIVSMAVRMGHDWPPGTTVYYRFFDPDDWYFAYLNPQTHWQQIEPPSLHSLDGRLAIEHVAGQRAWIDITLAKALDATPNGRRWLGLHTNQASVRELARGHQVRFAELSETP